MLTKFEDLLTTAQHDWAEWGSGQITYNRRGHTFYIVTDTRDEYGDGAQHLYILGPEQWATVASKYDPDNDEFFDALEPYCVGELEGVC